MSPDFLLYGANGFVGRVIARQAIEAGLRPLLAGRSGDEIQAQAGALGLEHSVFELEDQAALERALDQVKVVLHCAGPFIHTFEPMVEACLRQGTHYLDITGEIPVLEQLADRDQRAVEAGVMIMPAVGFDVVPTDCLAVHLKRRLPQANHLSIAFYSQGPGGMPPGTARTMLEMLPGGIRIRRQGQIVQAPDLNLKKVDLGDGARAASRITWGDLVTAHHSTGIDNIECYTVLPKQLANGLGAIMRFRWLFKLALVRQLAWHVLPTGSTVEQRANTRTHVWGQVRDEAGRNAVSRLHGPEGGVEWTSSAALTTVARLLDGEFTPGFQTPASVYGPDFVLEVEGVEREDLPLSTTGAMSGQ